MEMFFSKNMQLGLEMKKKDNMKQTKHVQELVKLVAAACFPFLSCDTSDFLKKCDVCSGYFKIRFSNFFRGLRALKVELTQGNFKYWVIFIWHMLVPKLGLEVKNVSRNKLNTSED